MGIVCTCDHLASDTVDSHVGGVFYSCTIYCWLPLNSFVYLLFEGLTKIEVVQYQRMNSNKLYQMVSNNYILCVISSLMSASLNTLLNFLRTCIVAALLQMWDCTTRMQYFSQGRKIFILLASGGRKTFLIWEINPSTHTQNYAYTKLNKFFNQHFLSFLINLNFSWKVSNFLPNARYWVFIFH